MLFLRDKPANKLWI